MSPLNCTMLSVWTVLYWNKKITMGSDNIRYFCKNKLFILFSTRAEHSLYPNHIKTCDMV